MKSLQQVTDGLQVLARSGPADAPVADVCADSRLATPGALFVAIRGYSADGHSFIADALARGAVAVVYEDQSAAGLIPATVAGLRVPNCRRAAAQIATAFWDHPSRRLCIAGVTGTNGKTTVSHLLEAVMRPHAAPTAIIGTLGHLIAGQHFEAARTTPDALELQRLFAAMVGQGVRFVSMEVSSHALALDRAYGTQFDLAVFTNLTRDHMDFHAGEDEYLSTKLQLFTEYADLAAPEKALAGVINADDPHAEALLRAARCRTITYGVDSAQADVRAEAVRFDAAGAAMKVRHPEGLTPVRLQLAGRFNVMNALAAIAGGLALGVAVPAAVEAIEQVPAIPGRFQRIQAGQDFTVIVDYAHTPDALQNVLQAARELGPRRLICVFGCGGDRDRGKRPLMGKVASELADLPIATSDNPRSEDPERIIEDILAGVGDRPVVREPDRAAAIARAVALAEAGDLVLIAGKGHETYQIFADHTAPFDDREVARAALRERLGQTSEPSEA